MPNISFDDAIEKIISTININQEYYVGYLEEEAKKANLSKDKVEEVGEKFDFILSQLDYYKEQIVSNISSIREKQTVVSYGVADIFSRYFAVNHMIYVAMEEYLHGKTDFIDKLNKYGDALKKEKEWEAKKAAVEDGAAIKKQSFEYEADEFRNLISSYSDKVKKTDQYLLMVEDQGSITENLIELGEAVDIEYMLLNHPEDHIEIESDDKELVNKIASEKKLKRAERRKQNAEKEKQRLEKARQEEEQRIKAEDELVDKYAKEESTGLYKTDIPDIEGNQAQIKDFFGRLRLRNDSLKRNHPGLGKIIKEQGIYLSMLTNTPNKLLIKEFDQNEQVGSLNDYIAATLILEKALQEKANGHIDVYNKLIGADYKTLHQDVLNIVKKSNIARELIRNEDDNLNLNNLRKILTVQGFAERTKDLRNNFELRLTLEGNVALRNDINNIIDTKMQGLKFNEEESKRYEPITNIMKSEMELLKKETLLTPTGNISPKAIYRISKIVACNQIIENDKINVKFLSQISNISENSPELYIDILANKLLKSDFINSTILTDEVYKNSVNLVEILSNTDKLAKKLNELNYYKNLFTGNTLITNKELDAVKAQVEQDNYERTQFKEENAFVLGQMKDGYYDVGRDTYLYTKNEMVKLADTLNGFADANNSIFSLIQDEKCPIKEELVGVFAGLQEVSAILQQNGVSIDDFNHSELSGFFRDDQDMNTLAERLDAMISNCDTIMEYDISDNEDFQKLYAGIVRARNKIDEITSGSLRVPDESYAKEEGMEAQFINASNPELTNLLNNFVKKKKYTDFSIKWVGNKEPLFSHDPSAKDIIQGNVGDCYFVSCIAAIASKNPQIIRDMMTYNEKDDTVTVRFYNEKNQPIYVTVENTIPEIHYKDENGEPKIENAFSRGARWVQIMEKAFDVSGLPVPAIKTEEAISGGTRSFAFKSLLGPQIKGVDQEEIDAYHEINVPDTIEPIFPKEYKQADIDLFYRLQSLHKSGKVLTTGTPSEWDRGLKNVDITALPGPHAYGIMGFSEENGFKFIHVKNPHSYVARGYDENHNPIEIPESAAGESKIELRDFINNFMGVSYAELNSTPINRYNESIVEKESFLYADTIKEMNYYLQGSGKVKAETEELTEQLKDLRQKSLLATEAIKNPHIKPNELHSILSEYFLSAQEYVNYRDQNPRTEDKEKTPFSAICYSSASVITKLNKIFLNNLVEGIDKAEYVDVDKLKAEALEVSEKDSLAKKCAVKQTSQIQKEMDKEKEIEIEKSKAKAQQLVKESHKGLANILGK